MSKPRLIAFYLPQFYPTPENDEWWSPGFTEWTNVGRAKPLFPGHYQPRVPADLGYYDLRVPETREKQAELAREAGIEGFCYWHYWFAGRRLLDRVFTEVVESGKPDFPFCLCWANHSWYKKVWNPEVPDKLLIEQTYPGEQDYIEHFNAMLPAFKDTRYMKVNGKLIFGLFSPLAEKDGVLFTKTWNRLAKENGLEGFYFFVHTYDKNMLSQMQNQGIQNITVDYAHKLNIHNNKLTEFCWRAFYKIFEFPKLNTYSSYMKTFFKDFELREGIIPTVTPNFDHSPRSKARGVIIVGSSPKKWKEFLTKLFAILSIRPKEENIVLVKSWNEWGEGNYLEPDLKYGKGFIVATKEALDYVK